MTDSTANELTRENERLRNEVALLTAERNAYHRAYLDQIAQTDAGLTSEQMKSAVAHGPWFEDFLRLVESGSADAESVIPPSRG